MANFGPQLKQILRRLGRTPGFTAITLITLAIGIGANTAIFSVVDGVLLKPLPYPHAEQLVVLWHNPVGLRGSEWNMAAANYFIYREQSRTFQDVGLFNGDTVSVTSGREPEQLPAIRVTDGMLPIFGVSPALGRLFSHQDDSPGAPLAAILGYSYWQRRFGGSPSALGRTLTLDGQVYQVIGVMPRNFQFLDHQEPSVYLPFQLDRSKTYLGGFHFNGIARLKPGVTLAAANADVARMLPIVARSFAPPPGLTLKLFEDERFVPDIHPLKQDVVGNVRNDLWILMGGIFLVLLIACANVANLLLVRAEGRQQELAIRSALGAGRGRIASGILLESAAIGLLGGLLGLFLAALSLQLLAVLAPAELPRRHEIGIDLPVLLFAFMASLVASLLSGVVPVLKYSGVRAVTGLRESSRTSSHGRERHRARNSLVVMQVALAFVLLICSGLMIRTFRALSRLDPGFRDPATVQSFRINIPEATVSKPEAVTRMQQAIQEKIAAIPGVSSVALTWSVPMDGYNWGDDIFRQDVDASENEFPPMRQFRFVSPRFFHTMGIPLVAGRDLTWSETYERLPVALVSENLARECWGSANNALGQHIRAGLTDDWREIIGVVADVHDNGVNQEAPTSVYWPILMNSFQGGAPGAEVRRELAYVIRTPRAGSESLIKEISSAVWSVGAGLPLSDVYTLDHFYTRSMARTSFTLVMLGIAGAAGLLLGIVGLYSVIAYSVAQRRKEIGIRMALGAQREMLVRMFVRQGLVLTGLGVVCGLAAAAGLTRLMMSLLFHVGTLDPMTYAGVTALLIVTAMLASYVPSRRAATLDPVETLRAE